MSPDSPLLLDVCGTLYDRNTSVAFLEHLGRSSLRLRTRWFLGAAKAWLYRRLGKSPGDCMRARIRMLAGLPRSWILENAIRFVEELESSHSFPESLVRLDASLASGRETWLVSATLDEILQGIATRHPGVRNLGSTLSYSNGICLGEYNVFLLEKGKLNALSELMAPDRIAIAEFATDDLRADADLASAVGSLVHVRMGRWE